MSYKHFTNKECEYYPCHKDCNLNCLFCFCPLYSLECGGQFTYTDKGIKDCSNCHIPHSAGGYDYIINKLKEQTKMANCNAIEHSFNAALSAIKATILVLKAEDVDEATIVKVKAAWTDVKWAKDAYFEQ